LDRNKKDKVHLAKKPRHSNTQHSQEVDINTEFSSPSPTSNSAIVPIIIDDVENIVNDLEILEDDEDSSIQINENNR
jgi:hypothetical protein